MAASQHYMAIAMSILKVTDVGNSVGVILPDEVMDRLGVKRGDILYAIETENGIELSVHSRARAQQIEIAERVMQQDHEAWRKLAE
jgi:putative addiction module antidote